MGCRTIGATPVFRHVCMQKRQITTVWMKF